MTPWSIIVNYRIVLTEYALGLPDFVANTTTNSYTFTTLEEFNNYTVVVAAENTVGLGDFSVIFNFSTPQAGMMSFSCILVVTNSVILINFIDTCVNKSFRNSRLDVSAYHSISIRIFELHFRVL